MTPTKQPAKVLDMRDVTTITFSGAAHASKYMSMCHHPTGVCVSGERLSVSKLREDLAAQLETEVMAIVYPKTTKP